MIGPCRRTSAHRQVQDRVGVRNTGAVRKLMSGHGWPWLAMVGRGWPWLAVVGHIHVWPCSFVTGQFETPHRSLVELQHLDIRTVRRRAQAVAKVRRHLRQHRDCSLGSRGCAHRSRSRSRSCSHNHNHSLDTRCRRSARISSRCTRVEWRQTITGLYHRKFGSTWPCGQKRVRQLGGSIGFGGWRPAAWARRVQYRRPRSTWISELAVLHVQWRPQPVHNEDRSTTRGHILRRHSLNYCACVNLPK